MLTKKHIKFPNQIQIIYNTYLGMQLMFFE